MGDAVLRTFADRLTQTLEPFGPSIRTLVVARFGGDEFVIVLRHASARAVGMQIAARLQRGIQAAHHIRLAGVLLGAEHRRRVLSG